MILDDLLGSRTCLLSQQTQGPRWYMAGLYRSHSGMQTQSTELLCPKYLDMCSQTNDRDQGLLSSFAIAQLCLPRWAMEICGTLRQVFETASYIFLWITACSFAPLQNRCSEDMTGLGLELETPSADSNTILREKAGKLLGA